jgi:hypothetical protein
MLNVSTPNLQAMESLVILAGMTCFAEDCDRPVKRAPHSDNGSDPGEGSDPDFDYRQR